MKFLKLGAFALALGMFAACGSNDTTESTMDIDTTMYEAPEVQEVPVDTTNLVDTSVSPMTEPVQ